MKKLFALVLALMLVLGAVAVAEEPLYISVISKGEQHAFWQTVRTGCEEAAAEYGVEMYYYGPPSESDIQLQVEALNSELVKEPDALCLAALSTESVLTQLEQCAARRHPRGRLRLRRAGCARRLHRRHRPPPTTRTPPRWLPKRCSSSKASPTRWLAATPEAPVVIAVLSQDATSE